MKKIILMSMVVCGAMFASADSLLYWMVTDSGSYQFDYAAIGVVNSSGETVDYLGMVNADGSKTATYGAPEIGQWTSLVSSDSSYNYANGNYSFFVELMNDDYNFVAQSALFKYGDIAQYIQTDRTQMLSSALTPKSFAIPEPTSGLMMLLGLGLLALRRKKA